MVLDDEGGAAATTAGAGLVQTNAYLTAAAVMIYTTRAIWLKLRKMKFTKKESESNDDKEKDEEAQEEYDAQSSAAQVQSQIIDVYPK